jgi:prepilin-type N-terminal cleavage/methylation domain-containing protein
MRWLMLMAFVNRRLRFLRDERGMTLVEMLIVMAVLGLVLAPLSAAFASAFGAELDQGNRFQAQESARLALNRMRKDMHCAHAVGGIVANAQGGLTLVLTQTNASGVAECPGLVQPNAASVQWCTVPVAGATSRYRLFRENDTNQSCDGTVSTFETDYLTRADLWTQPTCTTGNYPTVAVTLPVNVDPVNHAQSTYELDDQIALRNADPCS